MSQRSEMREVRRLTEYEKKVYIEAKKNGVSLYAWWKDGVQYVGTTGCTLAKALQRVEEEGTPQFSVVNRYTAAQALVGDALMEFKALRDEAQGWRDGIPKYLQESPKAEQLDYVIDDLDTDIGHAEEIVAIEIEFPAMFG